MTELCLGIMVRGTKALLLLLLLEAPSEVNETWTLAFSSTTSFPEPSSLLLSAESFLP